jgi:hypothetical protein
MKIQTMDEMQKEGASWDEAYRANEMIQLLLPGLKIKKNGRIDTSIGDKTPLGLYRSINHIMRKAD